MANDLEKRNKSALAQFGGQLQQDAGAGTEDFSRDDIALPFLNLLQALSPQVQRNGPDQVEGAEPGDFYNTVTGQIFKGDDGVRVIYVAYQKVYVEWVPRDQGGGFVAQYTDQQTALEQADPENDLVDTALHFIMIENPDMGFFEQAILPMTSTKLKTSRKWNSLVMMKKLVTEDGEKFTPPSYASVFRMSSVSQTNDEGTFYNIKIEDTGELTPALEPDGAEIYEACKRFREMVKTGAATANFSKADDEKDVASEEEGAAF